MTASGDPKRTASWFGMTWLKLIRILAFVAAMFVLIAVAGQFCIQSPTTWTVQRWVLD